MYLQHGDRQLQQEDTREYVTTFYTYIIFYSSSLLGFSCITHNNSIRNSLWAEFVKLIITSRLFEMDMQPICTNRQMNLYRRMYFIDCYINAVHWRMYKNIRTAKLHKLEI